jgi:hypothetical protein
MRGAFFMGAACSLQCLLEICDQIVDGLDANGQPAAGSLVVGQLARRLGLPLRCAGSFTNSKLPDAHWFCQRKAEMKDMWHWEVQRIAFGFGQSAGPAIFHSGVNHIP